jgi:hypothetical protein
MAPKAVSVFVEAPRAERAARDAPWTDGFALAPHTSSLACTPSSRREGGSATAWHASKRACGAEHALLLAERCRALAGAEVASAISTTELFTF